MARRSGNIMRSIRIQLKTGFMKEEPEEYLFMKRYPPIRRDGQKKFFRPNTEKVPYLDLLEKAAARNPLYGDRVYPAYWQDEPVGLTLAKKQYQFIQNGDSEEDAYRKAELYIDQLENKSYVELKKINSVLAEAGAKAPFLNDEDLLQEILQWQDLLKNVPYRTLSLADQGEIDFLLQTKVLKWKEGDRERRMKDPMFVAQFEQLRSTIFPNPYEAAKDAKKKATESKRQFFQEFGIKYEQAKAEFPFYIQDYLNWFTKLQAEPDTYQWRMEDRSIFSNWIIDTLALKCELNARGKGPKENQAYLNILKYQFFPMTRPGADPTQTYETPTVDSLRKVLFENEIGYKRQNGMVFVKRFYRIPSLLFPEDALLAAIIAEKHYAEGIVQQNDEEMLLSEIRGVGLDEAKMPRIMAQLRAYVEKANLDLPDYKNESTSSSSDGADGQPSSADASMDAVLGGIINDALGDSFPTQRQPVKPTSTIAEKVEQVVAKVGGGHSSSSDSSDSDDSDSESAYPHHRKLYKQLYAIEDVNKRDDFLLKTVENMTDEETAAFMTPLIHDLNDSDVDEEEMTPLERKERAALIDKYVKPATTELERDRDEMLRQHDGLPVSQARDETDMFMIREWRLEQDVRSRARAEFEYEEKEVARRQREFEKRRLWKMPRPLVPVVGYKQI